MVFRCFCLDSFGQSRLSTCGALQELWRESTRRDSRAKRVNRDEDVNIYGSQVQNLSDNYDAFTIQPTFVLFCTVFFITLAISIREKINTPSATSPIRLHMALVALY